MHEILREVCDIYEPIAENKSVDLRVEVAQPLNVLGDRDLLFEAVANLVDNAVKFVPEGGKVGVELIHSDDNAIVRVTDSGPGITEQEREVVLRRFYRSEKMRSTPGSGLGLNLVAAIVKLHGFRLAIHSGPGGRTEIDLPRPAVKSHRAGYEKLNCCKTVYVAFDVDASHQAGIRASKRDRQTRKNEIVFNGDRSRLLYIGLRHVRWHPTLRSNLVEYFMRSIFLALTLGCTLVVSNTAAGAESMVDGPTTVPGGAPIGHLQPRAQQFAPSPAAEQAEQEEMSNFDAQQQKLDEELDKHLNICRGC